MGATRMDAFYGNPCAGRGTGAAFSCSDSCGETWSRSALALIPDTMVVVSVFAFLGVAGLGVVLLLAALLIILARIGRAGAPKRQLLSI